MVLVSGSDAENEELRTETHGYCASGQDSYFICGFLLCGLEILHDFHPVLTVTIRVCHNFTIFDFCEAYPFLMGFWTMITNLILFFDYDVILRLHDALMTSFFAIFLYLENYLR